MSFKQSTVLLFVLLATLVGCKKTETDPHLHPVPETYNLRYEIDCPNCFVVYYSFEEEQISQVDQSTGWHADLEVEKGFVALLAAHNQSGSPAAITARIMLDGELWKTQTTFCPISGVVLVTDTVQ